MEQLKSILPYILAILLFIGGSLHLFKLEPSKSEMEAMNLGGYKMELVGIIDYVFSH
jgi:uncharacterized membrane protein